MFKIAGFLFLLLLSNTPHTCRTQPLSGASVIMATKNLLAVTETAIQTANVDGAKAQTKLKEVMATLQHNATTIQKRSDALVNETLTVFQAKIDSLGINRSDVVVNDCAISSSSVKSAAAEILMDANSCVSNTIESIERELNDTYSTIESILARINSDQSLAETCVAEYDKTEMVLRNAIVTALCVSQAKERILSAIKDELSIWNAAAFLDVFYIDSLRRLTSCDDSTRISSFVTDTDFIHAQMMTCIFNSKMVDTIN